MENNGLVNSVISSTCIQGCTVWPIMSVILKTIKINFNKYIYILFLCCRNNSYGFIIRVLFITDDKHLTNIQTFLYKSNSNSLN